MKNKILILLLISSLLFFQKSKSNIICEHPIISIGCAAAISYKVYKEFIKTSTQFRIDFCLDMATPSAGSCFAEMHQVKNCLGWQHSWTNQYYFIFSEPITMYQLKKLLKDNNIIYKSVDFIDLISRRNFNLFI